MDCRVDLSKVKFSDDIDDMEQDRKIATGIMFEEGLPKFFVKICDNAEYLEKEYRNSLFLKDYDFTYNPLFFTPKVEFKGRDWAVFASELIDGVSLDDEMVRSDPKIIVKILEILEYLYEEHGFKHGDLDISNIMIDKNGKLYLIDFEYSSFSHKNDWIGDILGLFFSLGGDGNDILDRASSCVLKVYDLSEKSTSCEDQKKIFKEIKDILMRV